MGRISLKAGDMVHVAGWPMTLTADVEVETNAANIPHIEEARAQIAATGNFVAGAGAPVTE